MPLYRQNFIKGENLSGLRCLMNSALLKTICTTQYEIGTFVLICRYLAAFA